MDLRQLTHSEGIDLTVASQIIRVEAKSNYCKVHFAGNQPPLMLSKVLGWLQERLPVELFVRVHRSHLVNRRYVQGMGGIYSKIIHLSNGESVAVSRRKQAEVKMVAGDTGGQRQIQSLQYDFPFENK